MRAIRHVSLVCCFFLCAAMAAFAEELPRATPEEAGFSAPKLEKVKATVQAMIDKKETAGVLTIVARHGKIAQLETFGKMDIEADKPMQPDTIFRIYSMSKPITTTAAMMLFEEGRFQLDDPVSKYLPEFKGVRVYAGEGKEPIAPDRDMTIRDLMRHTSGLTYGLFGNSPVDKMYTAAKLFEADSLADMVQKISKQPLLYQPGTHFNYSVSTDVLGRLVEVISGKSLDEFFQERIFTPLDMKDTAFFVPEEKLARFAANYGPDEKKGLKVIDEPAKSRYRARPKILSGGGGLLSTARDYLRFCQMILNGGELQGIRLLKTETVQQMTTNQLPAEAMPINLGGNKQAGVGFGLGFSVREKGNVVLGAQDGEYGWGGAASTHFWISPKQELIVVALQQYMPFSLKLELALKPVINAAIEK
jgi:CubicO group peptidase (beta-lactamase class C family)